MTVSRRSGRIAGSIGNIVFIRITESRFETFTVKSQKDSTTKSKSYWPPRARLRPKRFGDGWVAISSAKTPRPGANAGRTRTNQPSHTLPRPVVEVGDEFRSCLLLKDGFLFAASTTAVSGLRARNPGFALPVPLPWESLQHSLQGKKAPASPSNQPPLSFSSKQADLGPALDRRGLVLSGAKAHRVAVPWLARADRLGLQEALVSFLLVQPQPQLQLHPQSSTSTTLQPLRLSRLGCRTRWILVSYLSFSSLLLPPPSSSPPLSPPQSFSVFRAPRCTRRGRRFPRPKPQFVFVSVASPGYSPLEFHRRCCSAFNAHRSFLSAINAVSLLKAAAGGLDKVYHRALGINTRRLEDQEETSQRDRERIFSFRWSSSRAMALGSNFVAISYLFAFLHTIIPTIAVSLDYCSSVPVHFPLPLPIINFLTSSITFSNSTWNYERMAPKTFDEASSTSTSTATATSGVSTSSGAIITQTLPPGAGQTGGTTSSSSISGGAIAGIVIGTLLAIGLIISVILWLFCVRRRRENDTKIDVNGYEPPAPTPSFHSTIQSPPMTYQGGMSMNGGAMGTNDRYRLNVPGFTDSRMKKDVVIYPNGDRQSNISLQDNQDYSRPVLRLTNPDP
ncbi:conserved hypothetical protein [Histoplasma capsulatum G186AR]|uniref:ER membrane protein n=1 Tax=Ajellomyces capsulatus (strain G186AR / H82 / ATCC MYA-2454 / RMSCC 2432) TaxID=447093 RepID=C0NU15_AJECG|nr:uncharacterized protein HCBG_06645 [Histoplasma capsulatum G186AR]EEH05526.1 conserved hypothetical protein [Histoplasma capsulatum G186AR]